MSEEEYFSDVSDSFDTSDNNAVDDESVDISQNEEFEGEITPTDESTTFAYSKPSLNHIKNKERNM